MSNADWRVFTVDLENGEKEMVCAEDQHEAEQDAHKRWGNEVERVF